MSINKISSQTKENILAKTAYSLPDNPSELGMTPSQIKEAFYKGIIDSENALTSEIDRVVDEANSYINTKADKFSVSEELTLYASSWNSETKTQMVQFNIDSEKINEIVVMASSAEKWYEYGVYAMREISQNENSQNYGVVFYAKILPRTDLKFKIVTIKI